ncbi:unnamed protein product [Cuscuta campestris]|uniref:SWIM-type domain-containing protein n=1 Tax=Cuscuta campestris TaxID=132261 RepID=A0A484MFM0_9ASTE|nr:unnamed protein product [Cuscuta campestris]
MVEVWGGVPCNFIPLFVVELEEPSALQKMAEELHVTAQTFKDPSSSDAELWADNLLVTPTNYSQTFESEDHGGNKSKLNVRRQMSRTFEVLLQPSVLDPPQVPSITISSPHLSPTSTEPNTMIREAVENDGSSKKKKKKLVGGGSKVLERTELNVKLLGKELNGLEAYDIPALSNPQVPPHVPPLDLFFEEPVLPSQGVIDDDKASSEDEEEDCDFTGSEEECLSSEAVSLDEESEMEDEFDLDAVTAHKMMLGNEEENEDGSGNQSILEKMAKVFMTGRLWVRSAHGKVELKQGDIFSCKKDFLRVMKDYVIQKGISLRKIKNDKRRYTQVCMNKDCKFKIHASVLVDGHSWMIKSICEDHICSVKEKHNRAGAAWVATHLLEDFKNNKQMSVVTAQKIILKKFSTRIPDYTCWRALRVMRGMVEGRHEDGYKMLPQYMEVFKEKIQIPIASLGGRRLVQGETQFLRGVKSGPYEGVLLTAMALDGNNGQFPLAYGVADCEDETEWSFFLHGLAVALGCTSDASPYTIISDRHKAIIKGLRNTLPKAKRRICVLHFYKNFASKFSGAWFHSFFYIVANTFSEYVFKKAMEKIKEEDADAYDWLMDNEPHEHWARHKFDPALKCDDNTNNFVESFNKAIISHRAKPTLQMLEEIRKLIGNRFEKRFDLGRSWCTTITPYVDNKLRVLAMESRVCSEVVGAGRGEFDVVDGNTNFTVRLRDHHCDCNKWQVKGLHCKDAIRCILRMNENLENYCEDWFSVEKYRRLYDRIIHPIPDPCMWGESSLPKLDPPKTFKKKGRPKKHKRRDGIDDIIAKKKRMPHGTKHCSQCKQLGHNHRTCGQMRDEGGRLLKKKQNKKKKSTTEV